MSTEGSTEVAQTSHHWRSFRASRRYKLRVNVFRANLNATADVKSLPDPYVVIYLKRVGKRLKTTVQSKTLNPVWNQTLVFDDLSYDDEFSVLVKSKTSRITVQSNVFLFGFDFKVCEVLDLVSSENFTPEFTLTGGDKTTNYSGSLIAAFENDPCVPLGAVDGMLEGPCYVTFNGNFSSILLDMHKDKRHEIEKDDENWRWNIVRAVVPGSY